jgi:ectoine hydroxylase-related dioxygenase (phytanoyl-CoA dioxygenase family)
LTGAAGIHLDSGLWLDRPDAPERIAARLRAGELTVEEGEALARFSAAGYAILEPEISEATLDGLVAAVDRLWQERPADVAYAYDGPARRFTRADPTRERRTRYRIHDLHSHVPEALELYLQPEVFRMVELILDEAAVAIQSLFFEYGSEQVLHRDPVVVPTGAPGHLLAAWFALEDIGPDCGALVYVPGSHRLPYYEFAPGQYMFDAQRMGGEEIRAALAFDEEQCARHGLGPRLFTARKGQVLLWHASLRHGGAPVRQPGATRRSFVVHYSSRRTYPARSITISEPAAGGAAERPVVMETRTLLSRGGRAGFDSPMRGRSRP